MKNNRKGRKIKEKNEKENKKDGKKNFFNLNFK